MESVYILEPGSYLRREGKSLKVMKEKRLVERIPAENLKRLMIVGWISLSGGILDFLIRNRVETVFVTPTGRFRARLALDEHRHVARRRAQYLRLDDANVALHAARCIVRGKITNAWRFLLLRGRQYGDNALREGTVRLKSMAAVLPGVQDMARLRGMEGAASAVYFSLFPRLIRNDDFAFNGRNRRPPKDPVNALLSFVYTLLTNEVLSAIKTVGLDPYLGALHEVSYGRPSLACDLVEELRSFMGDRLVLSLINRRAVAPDDFVYRKGRQTAYIDEKEMKARRPVEMKPAVCRALIGSYERMMNRPLFYPPAGKRVTGRLLILNQVRRFGEFLEAGMEEYEPFAWEI